jgi:SARP family transcriptional regulator, regulator of embCAB operon
VLAIGVLGPVTCAVDGEPVPLAGLRRRALVAVLATARTAVPHDRLAAAVWSDTGEPPSRNTVQVHVHQLRQALGPHSPALRHTPGGYRLDGPEIETDVAAAEAALRRARAADQARDDRGAATAYREVLARFRGAFCADLAELEYFRPARTLYATLRLDAHEAALAAELRLRTPGLVGELEELVARHPLREGLWGSLMIALYREGRQADALTAYRRARAALADEVGLDPGSLLRDLERAILAQAGTTAVLAVVTPAGARRPGLTWLDGSGTVRRRDLPAEGVLRIGRDPTAEIALTWDGTVSRTHAEIRVRGGTATVADVGSRHGVHLDGERVAESRPLRVGDLLRCGDTVLAVTGPGVADVPVTDETR